MAGLFGSPQDGDAALLAGEGEAGEALIQALLEFAGAMPGETRQVNLRRDVIRYLEKAGTHKAWKKDVIAALDKLQSRPGFDLESECSRVVRTLRPVKPARAPKVTHHPKEGNEPLLEPPPPDPSVIDYAEKGRIAQQMGADLQQSILNLMAGDGTPEEKMAEATRMSAEYQAKIKALYTSP
jgi:hypothetical protein